MSFFNDMMFADNNHSQYNSLNKTRESVYLSNKYTNRICCLIKIVVLRINRFTYSFKADLLVIDV